MSGRKCRCPQSSGSHGFCIMLRLRCRRSWMRKKQISQITTYMRLQPKRHHPSNAQNYESTVLGFFFYVREFGGGELANSKREKKETHICDFVKVVVDAGLRQLALALRLPFDQPLFRSLLFAFCARLFKQSGPSIPFSMMRRQTLLCWTRATRSRGTTRHLRFAPIHSSGCMASLGITEHLRMWPRRR